MVMSLLTRPKKTVATVVVALDGTGDTTDIQTGINMLPAIGGVVYIKEGTYIISSPINLFENNTLIGAGESTVIYLADNSNCNGINVTGTNCRIEDLKIDGNKANNPGGGYLIYFPRNEGSGTKIHLVHVINGNTNGIEIREKFITISTSTITDCNGYGIRVARLDIDDQGSSNLILNSLIMDNGAGGIYVTHSTAIAIPEIEIYYGLTTIMSCLFYNNSNFGINLANPDVDHRADNTIINGNLFYGADASTDIFIDTYCLHNIVISNILFGATGFTPIIDTGIDTQIAHNITQE